MKSILEELYLGHLYPLEQIVPQDPEIHSVNEKKSSLMKILETRLPAEDYKALEEILDFQCDGAQCRVADISSHCATSFESGLFHLTRNMQ